MFVGVIKNLMIIGLIFNLLGAIILAYPALNYDRYFHPEKDKIIEKSINDDEFTYTTKRDINNSIIAFIGIFFMILGFAIQL